jgi:transcriptional regulator with XRE-family HTH domain
MAAHTPGEHIAELRKTYSLSLETLSERSGVSLELLNQIEDEGKIPDLAPLLQISRALGTRLGTLLDDREELGPVVTLAGKAGEATRFITGIPGSDKTSKIEADHNKKGLTFHSLAADKSGRHMEPFIIDIAPDAIQPQKGHEGEEFIHVLAGKLHIDYGKDAYDLLPGDSIYYDSIVPHSVLPGGPEGAQILAVVYTPA